LVDDFIKTTVKPTPITSSTQTPNPKLCIDSLDNLLTFWVQKL